MRATASGVEAGYILYPYPGSQGVLVMRPQKTRTVPAGAGTGAWINQTAAAAYSITDNVGLQFLMTFGPEIVVAAGMKSLRRRLQSENA